MMNSRFSTTTAGKLVAAAALAAALMAGTPGEAPASAANVVGLGSSDATAGLSGTNNLKITLVKGTDDTGNPTPGSVAGVSISLDRLKGIDPLYVEDMKRFEGADFADIQSNWPKDLHFEKVTDSEGTVSFEGLPTGVYVVTSVAPQDGNEYRDVNPFLVAVPFHTGDYQETPVEGVILAKAKTPVPPVVVPPNPDGSNPSPSPTPTATQPPATPTDAPPAPGPKSGLNRLPVTGAQVIGMVIAAALLIGAGFAMIALGRRRKNQR